MPQHRIFLQAERWFDRGRAASLGEIPCRRGCHRCCIGPFPITILDAKVLREGMVELDRAAQEDIEQRAKDQAAAIAQEFPQLGRSIYLDDWCESDVDRMAVRFAEFPCPALDPDGSCRLYRFRPLTCRLMGLPTQAGDMVDVPCEVQTTVPIIPLPRMLREEEDRLAAKEAAALTSMRTAETGEELLLPYGFLPDAQPTC
jgi:Fe-S-cluster containining protein